MVTTFLVLSLMSINVANYSVTCRRVNSDVYVCLFVDTLTDEVFEQRCTRNKQCVERQLRGPKKPSEEG